MRWLDASEQQFQQRDRYWSVPIRWLRSRDINRRAIDHCSLCQRKSIVQCRDHVMTDRLAELRVAQLDVTLITIHHAEITVRTRQATRPRHPSQRGDESSGWYPSA